MSWKKDGYVLVKKALSPQVLRLLAREFKLQRELTYHQYQDTAKKRYVFNDALVKKGFTVYALFGGEAMLDTIGKDIVEKNTKLTVLPTYSAGRIYYKGASMQAHRDRPSCEVSVTCCISADTPWPIWFLNRQGKNIKVNLAPGDMIIYSGCELPHWREKYEGKEHIQLFMHYVRKNKKNARYAKDGRELLGLPYAGGGAAPVKAKARRRSRKA